MLRQILLLVLVPCCLNISAQEQPFGIGLKHYRGVMWAHRSSILHLEAPTTGFDIDLYKMPSKHPKPWKKQYRLPTVGISLTYLDLGLPEVTGKAFGVLPFIEFRAIQKSRFNLNLRVATGIGYLTKKWDLNNNLVNKAIGSHLNGNMRVHLIGHYQFHPQWSLDFGGGITHFSNGNFKLPNLGVNSIEYCIGLSYGKLTRKPSPPVSHQLNDSSKRHHWEFAVGIASKISNLTYPKRNTVQIIGMRYYRQLWDVSRFGGGVEFAHDPSYVYRDNPRDVNESPSISNASELAIFLSHDLILGRLIFIAEGGTYLYTSYNLKGPLYQKLGFKYQLWKGLQARMIIKAHFARADYFEWGFAYTISR